MKAVAEFGVVPEALLADEGMAKAVLPALRADFAIYETYVPAAERAPLALPISALRGSDDACVSEEDLYTWGAETSCGLRGPEVFVGGHFFIEEWRDEVLATVAAHLQETLKSLPLATAVGDQAVPGICEERNMDQVFLSVAASCPDAEAVVDVRERVTYGELARRVRTLAATLQSEYLHGKAQQVVALLMPHDASYIASMLGIWQAAGILLVIEPHFPAVLVKEICEESGCVAAIASEAHSSKFDDVSGCKTLVLKGDWAETLEAPLDVQLPEVRAKAPRHSLFARAFEKRSPPRGPNLPPPRSRRTPHPSSLPAPAAPQRALCAFSPPPEVPPKLSEKARKDLSILMMTSGTTGRPKTIAGTHYFLHMGARVKAAGIQCPPA